MKMIGYAAAAAILAGCGAGSAPPIAPREEPQKTLRADIPELQKNFAFLKGKKAGFYHAVERGETLNTVARRYRVAPARIAEENNVIDANKLEPGQLLFIPTDAGAASPSARDIAAYAKQPPKVASEERFIWPVREGLLKSFSKQYPGVDFATSPGSEVAAAKSGRVVLSLENSALAGKSVLIDHGSGEMSFYSRMGSVDVAPDALVEQGRKIGTASSAPLHFRIYRNEYSMDPAKLLPRR